MHLGIVALDTLVREMLRVRADGMVFATDWPHTGFERYGVAPFMQYLE